MKIKWYPLQQWLHKRIHLLALTIIMVAHARKNPARLTILPPNDPRVRSNTHCECSKSIAYVTCTTDIEYSQWVSERSHKLGWRSLGCHGDGRFASDGAAVARGARRRGNRCAISSGTDIQGSGRRASYPCTSLSRSRSTSRSERASRAGATSGRPPPPPLPSFRLRSPRIAGTALRADRAACARARKM